MSQSCFDNATLQSHLVTFSSPGFARFTWPLTWGKCCAQVATNHGYGEQSWKELNAARKIGCWSYTYLSCLAGLCVGRWTRSLWASRHWCWTQRTSFECGRRSPAGLLSWKARANYWACAFGRYFFAMLTRGSSFYCSACQMHLCCVREQIHWALGGSRKTLVSCWPWRRALFERMAGTG